MKITKSQLKEIIREEASRLKNSKFINEGFESDQFTSGKEPQVDYTEGWKAPLHPNISSLNGDTKIKGLNGIEWFIHDGFEWDSEQNRYGVLFVSHKESPIYMCYDPLTRNFHFPEREVISNWYDVLSEESKKLLSKIKDEMQKKIPEYKEPSEINESNKKRKMKITKSQLKQIIREEASRLKKQYILEDKKKAIVNELRMLNENECETNCIKVLSLDNGNYSVDYNEEDLDEYTYAFAMRMYEEKYAFDVCMEFIYVDETGKNHKGKITIKGPGNYHNLEFEEDDDVIDEEKYDKVYSLIDNYRADASSIDEPKRFYYDSATGDMINGGMLNEKEEMDMSDIDMPIQDKAVFSAMNDEEVEDDLSDIIAKYTKKGGDYEGGYKDDVSVSPGYLSEMSADGDIARYEEAYEELIGRPGSEEEGRFLSEFNPQERIIDILKSAYINNGNSYFAPVDVSFMIMQMLKK